jgi:hypothetical protein
MPWLNVDIPLRSCTYHSDECCRFVMDKGETALKGIDELKRDGGWMEFGIQLEARKFFKEYLGNFNLINHC